AVCVNTANILLSVGDLRGANKMYAQAVASLREIGEKQALATALSGLGTGLFGLGDLTRAQANLEEALVIAEGIGDKESQMFCLKALSDVALARGDLPKADHEVNIAAQISSEVGTPYFSIAIALSKAFLLMAQNDFEG